MAMIMVSYRRADAQDMAGRIADYLIAKYGEKSVFFDVDSIPTGVNYHTRIEGAIRKCDVMVAVIGLGWMGKNPGKKPPRIHDPGDPVRVEIETALQHRKPILPLLVNGARMPEETDLPDTMRDLHSYNAAKVDSGSDFRIHMRRLIDSVNETLGMTGASDDPSTLPRPTRAPVPSWLPRLLMFGAGALIAIAVGLGIFFEWRKPVDPAPPPNVASPAIPPEIVERAKQHSGFIFPDSDQRLLGEQDLKGLSPLELRIARNEIFARRGRFFVDRILADYFSQFSWYHPRQVDVDLSPLETTNVNTITLAEGRK
jgi:hypothetical protein